MRLSPKRAAPPTRAAFGGFALLITATTIMTGPVAAADPVLLHAAGSLRFALTEVIAAYEAAGGALPDALAVGADYGMTALADAPPAAYRFAMFILSPAGQNILAKHGFSAPGLAQ